MAWALAHELNQPLGAVSSYGSIKPVKGCGLLGVWSRDEV